MPCSDGALVAAFRADHDDAFAEIVRRYRPRLVAYARRGLAGTVADAEDVVQDALVSAYGALRKDDRPMALRAWLYRIVHNRMIDERQDARRVPLQDDLVDVASTADLALARADFHEIIDALGQLPHRQRRALVMRAFDGSSYQAIGHELDASLPATKALLSRARLALRGPLPQPA